MKQRYSERNTAKEIVLLITGCIIYTLSTVLIKDFDVIPGSFLGVAVTLNKVFNFQTGLTNLILNIPVMVLVTRKLGIKVLAYTVFIMSMTSVLIDWWTPMFPDFSGYSIYPMTITSGVTMGLGAGLLIVAGGTMAGTTALTLLLQNVLKKFSFGTLLFVIDSLIVLVGCCILGNWKAIVYSLLYSFACAKTMDVVINIGSKRIERMK